MDVNLGLVLGIGVALLVMAGIMGTVLAFLVSKISPLPAKPPAAKEEPAEPVDEQVLAARRAAYRQGIYVFVGLAVLTVLEFAVASFLEGSIGLLFIAALAKAGIIIQYYMHLNQVWSEEESHG